MMHLLSDELRSSLAAGIPADGDQRQERDRNKCVRPPHFRPPVVVGVITDVIFEKIDLIKSEMPGMTAAAATATNPAIKAYSTRS